MTEENKPEGRVNGGSGIAAGGNVTIGDVSGQFASGENITITHYQSINQADFKEIRESLLEFQRGIDKLGLETDDQNIVNGNISSAIKETKEERPQPSKIKERFESAIETINKAKKSISNISELYKPAKKISKILGIGLSLL